MIPKIFFIVTISFILGIIYGLVLVPEIAKSFRFIIKAQMKIFNRQCRIFYILRIKNKLKK